MGKQTKNGGIILRCENNESISTLKENIQSKLNKKYNIEEPKSLKPRVKIVGIHEENDDENNKKYNIEEPKSLKPRVKIVGIHEENDDENLLERIITQNKLETTLSDLKVVHTSKPIKKRYNLTMECTHQLRDVLLKRENIFVGWMRCKVYEDLKIIRRQNSNHKPWITQKLKDTSILLREMSQVRKQINSPLYNERYNLLKKLYKQEINKAKKCYNDKRITESNNINKTCWEIIREHKNVTRTGKISIVKDGTEVSDLEIQDVFNDFFTNIIEQSPSPQGTYETDNKLLNSFYLTTVTPTMKPTTSY
ncbi:hypothetical protein QE152_g15337 [Popillia japonica]|uniref:Endonuclease-reverse transcriptase n=1 Tax=Popillia japonica TaxID=7064 RepID=A0AAW1L8N6_POPJA